MSEQTPSYMSGAARLLALLAAPLIFLLTAVTAVDVVGRYLFNRPLYGGYEITELLMGILVFATLPAVSAGNEHVTIGFTPFESIPLVARLRGIAVDTLCALAVGIIAWRVALLGQRAADLGDRTILLQLPIAPFAYVTAAFAAVSALIHLRRVAAALLRRSGEGRRD